MAEAWQWLIHSDGGLITRIAGGTIFFAILAIIDIRRNGKNATRWREYIFLLTAVVVAMIYGVANNQVTASISWEYFYYGKELESTLGPQQPPQPAALYWAAAKIGMMATWTVGLVLGVAVLMANNPTKRWPRLPYRKLYKLLALPFTLAVLFGVFGGLAGYRGMLNGFSPDFGMMWEHNIYRPPLFLAAWGVHLGGYIGGPLGAIIAVVYMLKQRAKLAIAAGNSAAESN